MDLSGVTLQKLKLFVLVYDKGSFNQAAQAVNLSQAAVSQHIRSLELALGSQLFIRSSQGVQPTAAGEQVYGHAVKMLAILHALGQTVQNLAETATQRLVIGATPGVSVYLLPLWIKRFQARYPAVSLSLETELTVALVRGVVDGRYAYGITVGELGSLAEAQLAWRVLRQIEYFVVVPANHPWAAQDAVTLEQLTAAPFVNRRPTSRSRNWLEAQLGSRVRLNSVAELDTPSTIIQALLNDVGVSILPEHAIQREVTRGEVVPLRLTGMQLVCPLLLLWRRDQPLSALQAAFLAAVPPEYTG